MGHSTKNLFLPILCNLKGFKKGKKGLSHQMNPKTKPPYEIHKAVLLKL